MRQLSKYVLLIALISFVGSGIVWADVTSIEAIIDGYVYGQHAVYATARDLATGGYSATSSVNVGQFSGANERVYRGFLSFPIPALVTADACTLYVNGGGDYSITNFSIYIHSAPTYNAPGGDVTTAAYSKFDGRQTAAAHDGSVLNDTWASTSYSAGWMTIIFNAAGLDTIGVCQGDTLKIALISSEDYLTSAPADSEYIIFDSSGDAGTEPYISLSYSSGWSGTAMGVDNPAGVMGVDKANLGNFLGVE